MALLFDWTVRGEGRFAIILLLGEERDGAKIKTDQKVHPIKTSVLSSLVTLLSSVKKNFCIFGLFTFTNKRLV